MIKLIYFNALTRKNKSNYYIRTLDRTLLFILVLPPRFENIFSYILAPFHYNDCFLKAKLTFLYFPNPFASL